MSDFVQMTMKPIDNARLGRHVDAVVRAVRAAANKGLTKIDVLLPFGVVQVTFEAVHAERRLHIISMFEKPSTSTAPLPNATRLERNRRKAARRASR